MKHVSIMKRALSMALALSLLFGLSLTHAQPAQAVPRPDESGLAQLVTGQIIEEAEISLIFEGAVDESLLNQLLPLLNSHGVKAGFFVPAITLAEQPSLAQNILADGHWLGNYLLHGERLEKDGSMEKQGRSILRAQEILSQFTGHGPDFAKGKTTTYDDTLLRLIKEQGVPYVLSPNVFLNHTSFTEAAQADRYMDRLPYGSVMSIKVRLPLEASEMPQRELQPTDRLTPQATPGPKVGAAPMPTYQVEERLLEVVAWVLDAMQAKGLASVSPQQLMQHQQSAYSDMLRQALAETRSPQVAAAITSQSPRAEVVKASLTLERDISLMLEGEASKETMQAILGLLAARDIRATFFLPALTAARQSELVESLLAQGHSLGNYLMNGEKYPDRLEQHQQVEALLRSQMVLERLGARPGYFKANLGQADDRLLQSVAAVGIPALVVPSHYVNHTSFSAPDQAEGYVARMPQGSILSIKMNQTLDQTELHPGMGDTIPPTPTPTASQQPVSDVSDPSPTPSQPPIDQGRVEERLIQVVDWLTAALDAKQMAVVDLNQLRAQQQNPLALSLDEILNERESQRLAASLNISSPQADVIRSGVDVSGAREVSILFEGQISREGLARIAQALASHQAPGAFFIPGKDMLPMREELQALRAQGHQLGNYLMDGEKAASALPLDQQVQSLYRAQQIAHTILDDQPRLFRANDSQPSEDLLRAGAAVGLEAFVLPMAYLNHTSFTSQQQVEAYAEKALSGAIIAFKMHDVISPTEAKLPGASATPSALAQATKSPQTITPQEVEDRLIQSLVWLLGALQQKDFRFVSPQAIADGQAVPYPDGTRMGRGKTIRQIASNSASDAGSGQAGGAAGAEAAVITSGAVLNKEISLVIEALHDAKTVQEIAAVLDLYRLKATFYLPAVLVNENQQLAKALVGSGHQLGNYLLSGETRAHQLEPHLLLDSMDKAQTLIAGITGQRPATFKGNLAEYSQELLRQVKSTGISFAVKPGTLVNKTSFRTIEQAQRFASRTSPGTLLSIKVDQVIDISEVQVTPAPSAGIPAATIAAPSPEPTLSTIQIPLVATQPPADTPKESIPLPEQVKWLVESYLKEGFTFVSPEKLWQSQQDDYGQLMRILADDKLTEEALFRYRSTFGTAPIFQPEPVLEKEISLVFEGTASPEAMDKLLALLDAHQVRALFLMPAKQAATQADLMTRLVAAGHQVGNYGLEGDKYLETLPEEQLLINLYQAQVILSNISQQPPRLFKGNVTNYTDQVQRVVQALGLEGSLAPNLYLNHSSFKDQAQVNAYVDKTQWGSILSLKLNQVLDITEIPSPTPKPLVTAPPQPKPSESAEPTAIVAPSVHPQLEKLASNLSNEEKLLKIAEWLLIGYTESGFSFVSPQQIAADANPVLTALQHSQLSPSGKESALVAQAPTTDKEIGLLLRFPPNQEKVKAFAEALQKTTASTIIAVTGNDIAAHAETIRQLADRGHYIVSAGFTGRSVTLHNYQDAYLEIQTNALLMQEKLGIATPFYAPLAGQVGQSSLQAAADLNVITLSSQIRARPTAADTVQDVMEGPFQWGVRRGDILYVDATHMADLEGLLSAIQLLVEDTGYHLATADLLLDNTYAMKSLESIPGWDNLKINPDYNPRADLKGKVFSHVYTKDNVVFLAIDDWGSDKTITTMLDILKEHDVVGNFFVINSRAARNPNLLRAISEAGHVVGSHGYDHELITKTPAEEVQALLVEGYQQLAVAMGRAPDLLFQPPQLDMSWASMNAVLATGFQAVVGSRVSTHDYRRTAEQVQNFVRRNLQRGAIILIHSSDVASANEALPGIIEYVKSKGYRFGRLTDYLPEAK